MSDLKFYNLSLLACAYFEILGKKYDKSNVKDRHNAINNFRNNKVYIKKDVLKQAFDLYMERLKVDFEELQLEIESVNDKK